MSCYFILIFIKFSRSLSSFAKNTPVSLSQLCSAQSWTLSLYKRLHVSLCSRRVTVSHKMLVTEC